MSADDQLLARALDEFEEERVDHLDVSEAASRAARAAAAVAAPATSSTSAESEDAVMSAALQQLIAEMQSPDFRNVLDDAMRELQGGGGLPPGMTGGGVAPASSPPAADAGAAARIFSALGATGDAGGGGDAAMLRTLDMLQRLAADNETAAGTAAAGGGAGGAGGVSSAADATANMAEDVIARMAAEFERMGTAEDFDPAVTGMMKQLLSRDLMYLPMKQITEAFPAWLAGNADKLGAAQYERHGRQYQCFQKLVALYEADPDNFPRLLELMQELQELGQPPAEIIAALAPGLELDGGLPALPLNLLAGGGGKDGAGGGEGCTIC